MYRRLALPAVLLLAAACADSSSTLAPDTFDGAASLSSSRSDEAHLRNDERDDDRDERDDENEHDYDRSVARVIVASNSASGNALLTFTRERNGTLTPSGSVATGGNGTGGGLGNQRGLVSHDNGTLVYVVNAGSDEISAFSRRRGQLQLLGTVPSGGDLPVSIAVHDDLLYVLNNGAHPNVSGFRIDRAGRLSPIARSARPLSGEAPNAAQVQFSPDGRTLVVTEKGTNQLLSWPVRLNGRLGDVTITPSSGQTPFGFDFTRQGVLVVSEAFGGAADASAVSTYAATRSGGLQLLAGSVGNTESAACWVAISNNGRFAYTTNTGSGTVSGYRVSRRGELSLLDDSGETGLVGAGTSPIDLAFTRGDRFLYVLGAGNSSVTGFRVRGNGSLTSVSAITGLPAGANGLIAF